MLKLILNDPTIEGYFNNSEEDIKAALNYIVKTTLSFIRMPVIIYMS